MYRVVLKKFSPDWRVEIIKALQQAAHLSVDEAFDLLDELPATVRDGLSMADAEAVAQMFYPGGTVAIEGSESPG
jgi:ribosomal protein L7/L12